MLLFLVSGFWLFLLDVGNILSLIILYNNILYRNMKQRSFIHGINSDERYMRTVWSSSAYHKYCHQSAWNPLLVCVFNGCMEWVGIIL